MGIFFSWADLAHSAISLRAGVLKSPFQPRIEDHLRRVLKSWLST